MKTSLIIATILGTIGLIIGLGLLFAFPVMWLWNWLCPMLFDLPSVNLWQAWGLSTLCGFLFRSTNTSYKSND
jgi:hypothetical protein